MENGWKGKWVESINLQAEYRVSFEFEVCVTESLENVKAKDEGRGWESSRSQIARILRKRIRWRKLHAWNRLSTYFHHCQQVSKENEFALEITLNRRRNFIEENYFMLLRFNKSWKFFWIWTLSQYSSMIQIDWATLESQNFPIKFRVFVSLAWTNKHWQDTSNSQSSTISEIETVVEIEMNKIWISFYLRRLFSTISIRCGMRFSKIPEKFEAYPHPPWCH